MIELFRLMMNHSMSDKDENGVLTKDEVKDALLLVMEFYKSHIIDKYGVSSLFVVMTVNCYCYYVVLGLYELVLSWFDKLFCCLLFITNIIIIYYHYQL